MKDPVRGSRWREGKKQMLSPQKHQRQLWQQVVCFQSQSALKVFLFFFIGQFQIKEDISQKHSCRRLSSSSAWSSDIKENKWNTDSILNDKYWRRRRRGTCWSFEEFWGFPQNSFEKLLLLSWLHLKYQTGMSITHPCQETSRPLQLLNAPLCSKAQQIEAMTLSVSCTVNILFSWFSGDNPTVLGPALLWSRARKPSAKVGFCHRRKLVLFFFLILFVKAIAAELENSFVPPLIHGWRM